jgi:hypothetical protein
MPIIEPYSDAQIDRATDQAMITLLWSAGDRTDEDGNGLYPWDSKFTVDDFADGQRDKMREIIAEFMTTNLEILVRSGHVDNPFGGNGNNRDIEVIGHDYVLTSGGHGTGFWDRGLGELGDRLTEACKATYREWYLYTGEERIDGEPGKLYCNELEG